MKILNKNTFKLCLLTLCISLSALNAQASSIASSYSLNPTDDFSVNQINGSAPGDSNYIQTSNTNIMNIFTLNDYSYLKFDVNSLKNLASIDSATLKLFGQGYGNVKAYYVSDDAWVNENAPKAFSDKGGALIAQATISGNGYQEFNFNNDGLTQLLNDTNTVNDGFFSLVLKSDVSGTNVFFHSKEADSNLPELNVSGAPVPEPSTALLGLMGLAGVIRARRKK